jgi:hypothetical protein
MPHRRSLYLLLGIGLASIGMLTLATAVVLFNQHLQIVRTSWGVFDIQIDCMAVTSAVAVTGLASVGLALSILAVILFRRLGRFTV